MLAAADEDAVVDGNAERPARPREENWPTRNRAHGSWDLPTDFWAFPSSIGGTAIAIGTAFSPPAAAGGKGASQMRSRHLRERTKRSGGNSCPSPSKDFPMSF